MRVRPVELTELMESMPAIVKNSFFQRRGHGSGHGFRIRARKIRQHGDGGKVHVRQLIDRQFAVARNAEKQHPEHDQGCSHGTANKNRRYIEAFVSMGIFKNMPITNGLQEKTEISGKV